MTSAWSMTTWLVSTRSNAASPKAVWFGRWIPFINCSISRSLNYPKWCRISCINREMSLKQNMFGSSFALFRPEPLWFHLGSTSCSQPFHNHPGPNHLDRICNCTIYKRKMKLREYSSSSEWFSYKLVDCLCSVTQSLPHTTSPSQTSFWWTVISYLQGPAALTGLCNNEFGCHPLLSLKRKLVETFEIWDLFSLARRTTGVILHNPQSEMSHHQHHQCFL